MEQVLLVNEQFVNYFRREAQTVSKKTARWGITKQIEGNKDNISDFIELVDILKRCFDWFLIEGVCIPYYKEIFGRDEKIHRYVNDGKITYEEWKKNILDNFTTIYFPQDDIVLDSGQYFDITTNFKILFNGNVEGLYSSFGYGNILPINIFYFKNLEKTTINILLEIRGEPFNEYPWGKENIDFYLNKEFVYHNRKLLRESMTKLEDEGFKIESFGFEWGKTHKLWKINKLGFIN